MQRSEFESPEAVLVFLETTSDLTGAVFQAIDLTMIERQLASARLRDNVLLGCKFTPQLLERFDRPLVFPSIPNLPFMAFRPKLYTPQELLGGYKIGHPETYESTVDGSTYRHFVEHGKATACDLLITLAHSLHDHGITDALQEFIAGRRVVAIMGGHSMRRDEPMYLKVARLSRELVRSGFLPASGGGPGAMEATHLGAWFAGRTESELSKAIKILAKAPLYEPIHQWLDTAFTVVQKFPLEDRISYRSLGVPTWLYGHEPPTCFATDIAKYFTNSIREEGLLAISKAGVVFAPGSAGTIQEIFQDATQNHYESFGAPSPMIFFGEDYWSIKKPIYPLLTQLAAGEPYSSLIHITDSHEAVLEWIKAFDKSRTGSDGQR